jgi:hypothetical protein
MTSEAQDLQGELCKKHTQALAKIMLTRTSPSPPGLAAPPSISPCLIFVGHSPTSKYRRTMFYHHVPVLSDFAVQSAAVASPSLPTARILIAP